MESNKQEEVNVVVFDKSKGNNFIDDEIDLDGIFNKAQTLEIGTDVDLDDLETENNKNLVKSNSSRNVNNENDSTTAKIKSNLIYKSAININKLAYESLKMNYLAKSFRISQDPPAGFGSVGHRHQFIYLDDNKIEQHRETKKQKNNQYHNDFNNSSLPLKV
jgi:hypothetical protein